MATYQFAIELIPKSWVEKNNNNIDLLFDGDFYDLSIAWQNHPRIENINSLLSNILPQGESWTRDLSVWGDNDKNDINLWCENGKISSITIRFDLREDIEVLKLEVIELARRLDCQLFFPDLRKIVDPNADNLNEAIASSNAAKFVNDPENFLDEISKRQ